MIKNIPYKSGNGKNLLTNIPQDVPDFRMEVLWGQEQHDAYTFLIRELLELENDCPEECYQKTILQLDACETAAKFGLNINDFARAYRVASNLKGSVVFLDMIRRT